jgi:nitrous oxidase accessory protein NosD
VARDLVVDPTDPAAFQEIDDAAAQAEDGDRIVVRPGIYRRPVVVDRAVRVESDGSTASIRLEPIGGEALGIAVSGATVAGLTIRPAEAGNDGGPWSAVAVHDATVTVEGCDLTSNAGATVWVGGPASRAVLLGCSLDGGSQNAVWVTEEGRAEVVACRVTGHRWPIAAIGEHAVLSIRDSEVSDNLDGGVGAADGATLIVEVSTIARNAGFGIQLESAAPASLVEDCTIEENATIGVGVDGGRGARIVRNRLRRNEVGITVTGGGAPTIEGNELPDNRLGIGVRGDDSDPVIVANTITGGASQGIVVDEQATGRFEGNRVSGCGEVGVWVDDAGTRPVFSGNHVSLCASVGIRVTHGAGGEFRTNDLRGNSGGSWGFHEPGALTRVANLEDAGTSSGEPAPRRLD